MKDDLKAIFAGYQEILFLQGGWRGVVFCALTLANPGVGLAGLTAVLAAQLFARVSTAGHDFRSGAYVYNPLLAGLSTGALLPFAPLCCFVAAAAGVLAFVLTAVMSDLLTTRLRLPVFSLPFVVVSALIYLGSARYVDPAATCLSWPDWGFSTFGADWPVWLRGFFKSLGGVFFAPNVATGLLLSLLVLSYSRILFLLALLGFYVGASARALELASVPDAFGDVNNLNAILIAMAVGGMCLAPSLKSYLLAAVAVLISLPVLDACNVVSWRYGVPLFMLPFNFTVLTVVFALKLFRSPLLPMQIGRTPEQTLENQQVRRLRYPGQARTLFLPFSGQWTVWQGFDAKWTHRGQWRYAFDFVLADAQGRTYTGDGTRLEDYFAYRKPVLSPVRGRVMQVIDDLPDSPVGNADQSNNWGNLVIIQDYRGFHVEVSHLAALSARVKVGDTVEQGTVLALCGNSGYSPQPHIHVQAQETAAIGAASLPFSFASYVSNGVFHANEIPTEKEKVEPLYPEKRLDRVTNFTLDEHYCYELFENGQRVGRLNLKVCMDQDGTFYFESARGRLFFGKHDGTFYFYGVTGDDPWLRRMFLASPRLPLGNRAGLAWSDYLPTGAVASGPRLLLAQLGGLCCAGCASVKVTQHCVDQERVAGVIAASVFNPELHTQAVFNGDRGFAALGVNGFELRRVDHAH